MEEGWIYFFDTGFDDLALKKAGLLDSCEQKYKTGFYRQFDICRTWYLSEKTCIEAKICRKFHFCMEEVVMVEVVIVEIAFDVKRGTFQLYYRLLVARSGRL